MTAALLVLLALHAQDPVRVGARLTEQEIHAGETTTLRVDVETDGPRAQIARFRTLPPGIEVVGTRDYDQRQFSLPGGTRRFITREYVLQAAAPGRYRIPSLNVTVDGDVYSTPSLLLTVTSAPTRPRGEMQGGQDGVILRAWLDADTVFVGEQVTLEVEAMFSQDARMRLRRAPEYEAPNPSGFWVHELPDPGGTVSRTVGAERYEVQRFRRAFFPLAAGDYTIPPARLDYEMRQGLLYAPETRELTSDPLPLVVLPVPADRPPAFTGAVGEYTMRARVEPASIPVGEAAVLTVEVEGAGNVKALPAPELPEVPGIDIFPPSQEAETEARGTRIEGRKSFSWVLIPRQAGELEIPPVRYAYFDPEAGGFETLATGPFRLTATPAGGDEAPPDDVIRFLKTAPEGDPLAWVRSSWFAALQALPLLLLLATLLWLRGRGRRGRVTPGALRRQRRQGIRELEERAGDPDDGALFADGESFARDWLARRLGLRPTETSDVDALARAGVPAQTATLLRTVLDRLSAGRYAPTPPPPEERQALIRSLGRALERVDGAAPKVRTATAGSGAAPGGARGWVILLAAAAVMAPGGPVRGQDAAMVTDRVAQTAEGEAGPVFARGVTAFQAGDLGASVDAFAQYVAERPRDPAGWYNLGTAQYRAGRVGPGVWGWLKAVHLDPRDRDARHNLRVAGVPPELVRRVTPALPLRYPELLLLGALAWLAAGVAGSVWLARRRGSAGGLALLALAIALSLGAAAWGSTHGRETLIVLEATTLRAGPALGTEPVTTLEPGTGLIPVEHYGDWVRARTLRGDEGWIEEPTTGTL